MSTGALSGAPRPLDPSEIPADYLEGYLEADAETQGKVVPGGPGDRGPKRVVDRGASVVANVAEAMVDVVIAIPGMGALLTLAKVAGGNKPTRTDLWGMVPGVGILFAFKDICDALMHGMTGISEKVVESADRQIREMHR